MKALVRHLAALAGAMFAAPATAPAPPVSDLPRPAPPPPGFRILAHNPFNAGPWPFGPSRPPVGWRLERRRRTWRELARRRRRNAGRHV